MFTAVNQAASLSLVWIFVVTLIYLFLREDYISDLVRRISHPVLTLVIVATIVRIIPLLILPVGAGYDIDSFRLVGDALLNGEDVYTSSAMGRHPYLPLHMYLIGLATYLHRISNTPFVILIKIPALVADILISVIIFKSFIRWQKSESTALFAALLYALNPISILVSAYHGQFDAIPVLLLALAWYDYHFSNSTIRSAVSLGFAILSKTWPIVFLPVVFIRLPDNRRRLLYTTIALIIPILFTVVYVLGFASDPVPMLRRAFTHMGVPGFWGPSAAVHLLSGTWFDPETIIQAASSLQRILLVLIGIYVLWYTRKQQAIAALLTIMLSIFSVMLGMGLQWLLWPIAFAILAGDWKWQKWYSIMGSLMILVHLFGLHLVPWAIDYLAPETTRFLLRVSSLPVWLTIIAWAISRLRRVPKINTSTNVG